MSKYYDEDTGDFHWIRLTFKIVTVLVVVSLIFGAANYFIGVVGFLPTRFAQVVKEVTEPERVVYTYEHFYDMYEENIKPAAQKYWSLKDQFERLKVSLPDDSEDWTYQEKEKYDNLSESITGVKNRFYQAVGEYNADSRKLSRNIFKGKDLPEKINPDKWLEENRPEGG